MRLILISALVGVCAFVRASQIGLLPGERPFRHTFADPREIRMALAIETDARLHAAVGNYFSLLSLEPEGIHFGFEGAGYFTMRQAEQRFPLETADGLIGAYLEGGEIWQWQLRFTHISAHLADGSLETPIPYSRETVSVRGGWLPIPELHLYGGIHFLTNSIPELPRFAFQCGGSYFLNPGGYRMVPFVAFDLKWRRETSNDPSFQAQMGVAINDPPEAYRSFRVFYSYYTGADPRGQFYFRSYTSHSLGIEMQI